MTPALSPQYWFFRGDKGYAVCNLISESGTRILVVFNGTEGGGGHYICNLLFFLKLKFHIKVKLERFTKTIVCSGQQQA